MEATQRRYALDGRKLLGTRSGTLTLAAIVAVIAGVVLIVFLAQYRDNVKGGTAPTTALVAGSLIPKGTAGDIVIDQNLFKPTQLPKDDVSEGAVLSAGALAGKVAVEDIYPGQQITAADFAGAADSVRGKLTGDQRAVSVPLDGAHGLIGTLRRGDRVDVLAGFNSVSANTGVGRPVVRTLMQNVLVLDAPEEVAGGVSQQGRLGAVTLRVSDRQAGALAYAADNGKVWLALRAPTGASATRPSSVSLESLLSGSTPITEDAR